MVKKRSSFAQHGPYLAIVAVVAVVAIVFLILNFAGVSPVGEASKLYVPKIATAPSTAAKPELECKNFDNPTFNLKENGYGFCSRNEYDTCAGGSLIFKQTFQDKQTTAFIFPVMCSWEGLEKGPYGLDEFASENNIKLSPGDAFVTCCRIN